MPRNIGCYLSWNAFRNKSTLPDLWRRLQMYGLWSHRLAIPQSSHQLSIKMWIFLKIIFASLCPRMSRTKFLVLSLCRTGFLSPLLYKLCNCLSFLFSFQFIHSYIRTIYMYLTYIVNCRLSIELSLELSESLPILHL